MGFILAGYVWAFLLSGLIQGMTYNVSSYNFLATDDASMSNVLTTARLSLPHDSLLYFYLYFPDGTSASRLDVYQTSVLGQPMTLLASYLGADHPAISFDPWQLCLPAGQYQLAFVAFAEPGAGFSLSNVEVSQQPCAYVAPVNDGKLISVLVYGFECYPLAVYCEGPGTLNFHVTIQDGRFHGCCHL